MFYVNTKTGFFCESPSNLKPSKTVPRFRFLETTVFEAVFLDAEGEPLDLTGGSFILSLSADLGKNGGGNIIAFSDTDSCEIVDPAGGTVRFRVRGFSTAFEETVKEEQENGKIEAVYTPAGELEGKVLLDDPRIRILPRVYTGEVQTEDLALNYYTKGEIDSFLSGLRISLAACTGVGEYLAENAFTMTWVDPDDVILNGATLAQWNQTVLVRKTGSYPADPTDGTVLATTSRALGNKNAYRSNGFTDSTRATGTTYYYKLFSQTTSGVWNDLTGNQFAESTDMSWGMVQGFVRAGRGPDLFPVGTVFEVDHTEYNSNGHGIYFRVAGHDQVPVADETLMHTMCLEMVDVVTEFQYDYYELPYALTGDVIAQAGKVYYTYDGSTYTNLIEGTDYDAGDPVPAAEWYEKNYTWRENGSNNPVQSNMIQWANSTGTANNWFIPQTIWDTCNSTLQAKNGFMKHLDPDFAAVVEEAKLITAKSSEDGGGSVTHTAKFWPLSLTQIYGSENNDVAENVRLKYYADGGNPIKYNASGTKRPWWLRSPLVDNATKIHVVFIDGEAAQYMPIYGAWGISLACIIA